MMLERKKFQPLSSSDVCQIYELLYSNGLVSFPITKEACNRIDSAIASINSEYFGVSIYDSFEDRALAYLYFLIKDHPFTDGNKRTACLAFFTICQVNGLFPRYDQFGLDVLAVYIEKVREKDHHKAIRLISSLIF